MRNKKFILLGVVVVAVIIGSYTGLRISEREEKIKNLISDSDKLVKKQKYEEATKCLEEAKNIKSKDEIGKKIDLVNKYIEADKVYKEAMKLIDDEDYDKAIEKLNEVNSEAEFIKNNANFGIKECKCNLISKQLCDGEEFLEKNQFQKAYECVEKAEKIEDKNSEIESLKNEIENLKNKIDNEKKAYEE